MGEKGINLDSISIALSGLRAQSGKTAASAENISNVNSYNYTPKDAVLSSNNGSGVEVSIQDRDNPTFQTYAPSSALADDQGYVAVPNIALEEEFVNLITAEIAYKANISVIKTSEDMQDSLLDVLT